LDVFTIYDELQLAEASRPLTVVLLGDLKHGRTVHSLAKLLSTSQVWKNSLTLRYCSPECLPMPESVKEYVAQTEHVTQEVFTDPVEACQNADVLYVTRIQRERFETEEGYNAVKVRWDNGVKNL
jgi:aspartate carbamoyltransferase catalytic subunit